MTSKMVERVWANIGYILYQIGLDSMRGLVRRLERLHLKFFKKKQSVVFNQTCLNNDLLPNYTISLSPSLSLSLYIYIYVCVWG